MIRTLLTRQDAEAPQFQEVRVRLPNFDGPLDMLLYLIKKDRIEITDISISRITRQYLTHLELMKVLNMEVAGEFLVMAATLMRMKSQMLLPRPELFDEDGDEPLTQEELIERLLRYHTIKAAAQDLKEREEMARHVHPRGHISQLPEDYILPLKPVSLYTMAQALQDLLSRAEDEPTRHEVQIEDVRLEDQTDLIKKRLEEGGGRMLFRDLFTPPYRPIEVAVTFLSLLELCRMQILLICQLWTEGDIWILDRRPSTQVVSSDASSSTDTETEEVLSE
ncbi:MAG: segregation/condensation protein A [Candidatus Eisenbacteria bacterium]|nr:segregation/condensation protein A [Candidatus Eisenbacteria bacterium]MBU1947163.1 segregation/condensation protein A [Candidatus Eisenbacteria bacterium]